MFLYAFFSESTSNWDKLASWVGLCTTEKIYVKRSSRECFSWHDINRFKCNVYYHNSLSPFSTILWPLFQVSTQSTAGIGIFPWVLEMQRNILILNCNKHELFPLSLVIFLWWKSIIYNFLNYLFNRFVPHFITVNVVLIDIAHRKDNIA